MQCPHCTFFKVESEPHIEEAGTKTEMVPGKRRVILTLVVASMCWLPGILAISTVCMFLGVRSEQAAKLIVLTWTAALLLIVLILIIRAPKPRAETRKVWKVLFTMHRCRHCGFEWTTNPPE